MKGLIALLSITLFITACSQNTNKQEFVKAENAAPAQAVTPKQSAAGMKLTKPTELLPEITAKYSAVKIEAVNKNDGSKIKINAPFGQKTAIGDTGLEIVISSYFTNFTMVDGGVKNVSMEEENPAAKVVILEQGNQVFDAWLFQKFPTMHPFEHPVWQVVLTGAVKK